MVEILRHSQTKERVNRERKHQPKEARQFSTLPGSHEVLRHDPSDTSVVDSLATFPLNHHPSVSLKRKPDDDEERVTV